MICNFRADTFSIEKKQEKAKKAKEFCYANQILKNPGFWNLASKKPIWQPWHNPLKVSTLLPDNTI